MFFLVQSVGKSEIYSQNAKKKEEKYVTYMSWKHMKTYSLKYL